MIFGPPERGPCRHRRRAWTNRPRLVFGSGGKLAQLAVTVRAKHPAGGDSDRTEGRSGSPRSWRPTTLTITRPGKPVKRIDEAFRATAKLRSRRGDARPRAGELESPRSPGRDNSIIAPSTRHRAQFGLKYPMGERRARFKFNAPKDVSHSTSHRGVRRRGTSIADLQSRTLDFVSRSLVKEHRIEYTPSPVSTSRFRASCRAPSCCARTTCQPALPCSMPLMKRVHGVRHRPPLQSRL